MTLRLHKVTDHPQADNAYRVIYTTPDGEEFEAGSIGQQRFAGNRTGWTWGIDDLLERQDFAMHGEADDREDAMAKFKAAWEKFASEPVRLTRWLDVKRAARRGKMP